MFSPYLQFADIMIISSPSLFCMPYSLHAHQYNHIKLCGKKMYSTYGSTYTNGPRIRYRKKSGCTYYNFAIEKTLTFSESLATARMNSSVRI
jgi:hypothetical protein